MTGAIRFLERLEKLGRIGEDTLLVVILSGMIFLAAGQIVLRNFFSIGFLWGDEFLRLLVLWVAVAGAVAASRNDKHINIAVLDRFLPAKLKVITKVFVDLFTCAICGIVCWFSIQFVLNSFAYGDVLLGAVPAWVLQLILPIGFGLISYRYGLFAIKGLLRILSREPQA